MYATCTQSIIALGSLKQFINSALNECADEGHRSKVRTILNKMTKGDYKNVQIQCNYSDETKTFTELKETYASYLEIMNTLKPYAPRSCSPNTQIFGDNSKAKRT